jgi:hypothetical protein
MLPALGPWTPAHAGFSRAALAPAASRRSCKQPWWVPSVVRDFVNCPVAASIRRQRLGRASYAAGTRHRDAACATPSQSLRSRGRVLPHNGRTRSAIRRDRRTPASGAGTPRPLGQPARHAPDARGRVVRHSWPSPGSRVPAPSVQAADDPEARLQRGVPAAATVRDAAVGVKPWCGGPNPARRCDRR